MTDALSLKQLNRTFIGSVLFMDIVGYSRRTVPEQLEMKELFNTLLQDAVQNVAPADRIMVDTGDGAAIAFLGDPEDALFAALSLRDAIGAGRAASVGETGFVRMGINLGPLKIVRDINGHTNMIGDGVNDAQRVMSFADAGQVMVSHSYFDIISRFSHDYAQLFVYEGTRQDKHVREHEVYRFGPVEGNAGLADKLRDRSRARASEADAPAVPASAGKARMKGLATGAKASRAGLIAAGIGALTLVGAVWSWSSRTPEQPHAADATPTPTAAVPVPSTGEADPIAQIAASASAASPSEKKAAAPASGKAEDTKLAAKAESATKASSSTSASASAIAAASAAASESASAAKPGTVKLAIQPWGEIYVDGGKRGISPPVKSLSLPPGKHRIEVRNGDFAPYKETVEVRSGAEATVHYVF